MADAGASSIIMLVTSLIIAGSASIVLVNAWDEAADSADNSRRMRNANSETSVALAGDTMNVEYDGTSKEMTFYLQNEGVRVLDDNEIMIVVDGVNVASTVVVTFITGTVWNSGNVIQVVVDEPTWTYSNNDEVSVNIIVKSVQSNGVTGSDSITEVVRLNV